MARVLTDEHKAAMAAGRTAKADANRLDTERRKAEYSVWSKTNAKAWMLWLENCGRSCVRKDGAWVKCECEYCLAYRTSNSAMPDMRNVEGETVEGETE